jgi:hypothetical protein
MVRYTLNRECQFLWKTKEFKDSDQIFVPYSLSTVYVNIMRVVDKGIPAIQIKAYYGNGNVIEGWLPSMTHSIDIENHDELFDGRFNQ